MQMLRGGDELIETTTLVEQLAQWVWKPDPEWHGNNNERMSPEFCLELTETFMLQDFWQSGCLTRLASKVIDVCILVGSMVVPLPSLCNLMRVKSSEGISRTSKYLDIWYFANSLMYSFLYQYPFSAYGENLMGVFWCSLRVSLIWKFTKVPLREKGLFLSFLTLFCLGSLTVLPPQGRFVLHAINDVIAILSYSIQIRETHRVKHTGTVSIFTVAPAVLGTILRIFTTHQEANHDLNTILCFGTCLLLDVVYLTQFAMYWRNTQKFLSEQGRKRT